VNASADEAFQIVNTMALRHPPSVQHLAAHARWAAPLLVIILASSFGHHFGLGVGLLTVAGGVLCGSIWLIWSSLQGLSSEAPLTLDEALSLGAPSAEEEQKRAVLRALKDLEYERAVGKINEADYANLAEHYRNEAKRLLRAVDADLGPERERAEQILAERLATLEAGGGEEHEAASSSREGSSQAGGSEDDTEAGSEPAVAKSPSSGAAP
jgi:hypothetical protein